MMSDNQPRPGRRGTIIGWSVFVVLLATFGWFLAHLVPPQPRTQFELAKERPHQNIILQLLSNERPSLVTFPDPEQEAQRGPIQVWDTDTGRCRQQFLAGIDLYRVKFSPKNRFLAVNDSKGFLHLVDFRTNTERQNIIDKIDAEDFFRVDLVISPRERYLLRGMEDTCSFTNTTPRNSVFLAACLITCGRKRRISSNK